MRALLSAGTWVLFFATTVYGHAALKVAMERDTGLWSAMGSRLALSAFGAWAVSAVAWALVLRQNDLFTANVVASLRYALICVVALVLWPEALSARRLVGVALVGVGILLVAKR